MAVSEEVPKEVFLSYGRDPRGVNDFVQKLKADLEAAGISVWQDKEDIEVGSDWHNKIGDGVYECCALLCVLTKKYINSRNCRGELFLANEKKKLIFPVMYEDIDWDKESNSRGVGYVVNSFNRANFRPEVDYQLAVKKLIEGMKRQGLGKNGMQEESGEEMQGRPDSPQGNGTSAAILSQMVYDVAPKERNKLFRKYVSEPGAGKARAVLEGLGLEDHIIDECFTDHSRKVVDALQEGLVKWKECKGDAPTWEVLLEAMDYAGIGQMHIVGLKKALGLPTR